VNEATTLADSGIDTDAARRANIAKHLTNPEKGVLDVEHT
jgi:hypothetical protein